MRNAIGMRGLEYRQEVVRNLRCIPQAHDAEWR